MEGTDSAPEVVGAKPFVQKPKNIRKRKRAASDDDEDEQHEEAVNLHEIKEDQKMRSKQRGVDPMELLKASAAKTAAEKAGAKKLAEKSSAAPSGLQETFSRTSVLEANEENPHLRNFIESKIHEMRASKVPRTSIEQDAASKSRREPGETPDIDAMLTDDKWLYELPAHLRPVAPKDKREADAAEGGALLGGTGIAEVSLPDSFKLKTIEDTVKATEHLLRKKAAAEQSILSKYSLGRYDVATSKDTPKPE